MSDGPPEPLLCFHGEATRNTSRLITTKQREGGFTLIELMVVIGIIGALMVLLVPALSSLKGANDVTNNAYTIKDVLEQARTYALAKHTYVWVGFFEESSNSPATAGTGRVVVSVVASKNGTRVYSDTVSDPPPLSPASLIQISKPLKIENTHLERIPDTAVPRADVPVDQYHVGHADFAKRVQFDGSVIPNNTTFPYPLNGTSQYTFTKIIQFNPQGDATKIADTPTRTIEVGLRPTHGSALNDNSRNLVVIQLAGITGQSKLIRP
jgi:prepilin-type N-terminal cleavage/methylation domain-containing protein